MQIKYCHNWNKRSHKPIAHNYKKTKELRIREKSSHPRETSYLSEISAEWYISLCKNK